MYEYPSISGHVVDTHVKFFPKYDGANVRVKWTRKQGFADFGSRTRLLDASEPFLGASVALWRKKYEDAATEILRRYGCRQAVLIGELYGPTSFAGHFTPEEPLDVMLYDLYIPEEDRMLTQTEFGRLFRGVEIAPVLYEGKPSEPMRLQVKEGTFPGQTFEGVICKGGLDNRGRVVQFKIKSNAWFDRLRVHCGGDQALFDKLA